MNLELTKLKTALDSISTVKATTDDMYRSTNNNVTLLTELSATLVKNTDALEILKSKPTTDFSPKVSEDVNLPLVYENSQGFQNRSFNNTPPTPVKTPPAFPRPGNALARMPVPPRRPAPKRCHACGELGHINRFCPNLNQLQSRISAPTPPVPELCCRCLSPSHQAYDCAFKTDICTICRDSNLGSLAIGHVKDVHGVTDPNQRDKIIRIISPNCFPEWYSKRPRLDG